MRKKKAQKIGGSSVTATDLKNRVRGALARLNDQRPAKKAQNVVHNKRLAQELIINALATAREHLSGRALQEFEVWAETQYSAGLGDKRVGADKLSLGVAAKEITAGSLADTLTLTLDSLRRDDEPLGRFCALLRKANEVADVGDYVKALDVVDATTVEFGISYWAIEAQIALLSSLGNTAEAKQFIAKLSVGAPGLNSFYFYHIGLRNEISQSPARLRTVVRRRLAESTVTDEYKQYSEFRIFRYVDNDKNRIANILSIEQTTSKIDLLLTSVRMSVQILGNSEYFTEAEIELANKILALPSVQVAYSTICFDSKLVLSPKLIDAVDCGISAALEAIKENKGDSGAVYSAGIAATVSYSGNESDEDKLKQHVENYWYSPDALLVDSLSQMPRLPDIYAGKDTLIGQHPLATRILNRFWSLERKLAFDKYREQDLASVELPNSIKGASKKESNPCVLDCIGVRQAWSAYDAENYQKALRISHLSLRRNNRLNEALPLRRMFERVPFDVISSYGSSIDLSNCLHWYTQIDAERQIRTFKRFSIEKWIAGSGHKDLLSACVAVKDSRSDIAELEFFLSETSDISTLELLSEVDSTRDALELKSRLLYLASGISNNSSAQFLAAADMIKDELDVGEVLDELDETMVSVDEAAILPSIERELASDFSRYKTLIADENDGRSSVDDLVRSLRNQSAAAFQIPKNESADLLINMIQTVLDKFVDDPVYGLDAIIGRRIRHGTISSELRGTLEQVQLIGQRPKSGADYAPPKRVMSDIANLQVNKRGLIRAFDRFSAAIDLLVAQLRDEVFQCKVKGKLTPVFELPITAAIFAAARDSAATAPSVITFATELFDTFWFVLSIHTDRHRLSVKNYTQSSLKEAFAKLVADLKGAGHTAALFHSSIQGASEELQRKAEVIAGWVQIPKLRSSGRSYSVKLIFDATLAQCKARWSTFEPVSIEDIDASINLDAHGYPIVFDALRIALENVALHSGIRQGNRIETSIAHNSDSSKLCFKIVSDVSKDSATKDKLARIDSIRADIEKRSFADRAKRTSGSGLAKLATLVQQRPQCDISFALDSGLRRFTLTFELAYIPLENGDANQMQLMEI